MIVWKFGGTSVGDADRLRSVAALIRSSAEPPVVVVSAVAGVTNLLSTLRTELVNARWADAEAPLAPVLEQHLAIARELELGRPVLTRLEELVAGRTARIRHGGSVEELADELLSLGEDLSTQLLAAALVPAGVPAVCVDARGIVRTDDRFGAAVPMIPEIRRLARTHLGPHVHEGRVPIVQGFVGATEDGRTTTLGRGGSDFTATILGAALEADEVRIWTDVDGIFSADPNTVEGARIIEEIGFEEAVELSHFGARVLHPGAAKHAVAGGLEVAICNALRPGTSGTVVLRDRRGSARVAAVVHKPRVVLVKVRALPSAVEYGFLARVFGVLADRAVPVDLVSTSHTSTAFTIDEGHDLDPVLEELAAWAEVDVVTDLATVTVVGHGLMAEPGIVARVFAAVGSTAIHLVALASDVSLSFLVDTGEAVEVVRRLHTELVSGEVGG